MFYEHEDNFEVFGPEYLRKSRRCIQNRFSMKRKKSLPFSIHSMFRNVTKNLGLLLEIAKKLTLFELFYEEKFFSVVIKTLADTLKEKKKVTEALKKREDPQKLIKLACELLIYLECRGH